LLSGRHGRLRRDQNWWRGHHTIGSKRRVYDPRFGGWRLRYDRREGHAGRRWRGENHRLPGRVRHGQDAGPPASQIDIALKATASSTPTTPPSSSPAPAGKVVAEVVGSWVSQSSGTDIYTIKGDGTYSRNLRDSFPCYLIQRVEYGNAVTSGDQITFYPTSNVTKVTTCGSYSEDRSLVPVTTFTYRFETDPINANRYLFLKPASGTELQYRKE
jgi:hypothetical protein